MQPHRVHMEAVEARSMPSRMVREILSARTSAAVAVGLRLVDILPAGSTAPRFPHVHRVMEEVIICLDGEGATWVDGTWWPLSPGVVMQIPAGAVHGTVNPGASPLRLLCFFPSGTPEHDYTEFPEQLLTGWETAGS